jgi:hypothetical protein
MVHNIAEQILLETDDFRDARHLVDIEGLSSPKVCNFLNRLVANLAPGERYLEIGTWKGRTLFSAAFGNHGKVCVGCDKFRLWGKFTGPGWLARRAMLHNITHYRDKGATVHFHHMTSRALFAGGYVPASVGIYFYDGDHSYEETHHGMEAGARLLSPRAVVLVDDWNDPVVQRGARAGMDQGGLRVLWHRELPGNHTEGTWWNGLGVFYVER